MSSGLARGQQTLYWDPLNTPTTPSGGAGTWDTTTTSNWSNLTTDVQWTDNFSGTDTAVFGGTAGTVNISAGSTSTANVLVFNTSGYNITGGQDLNLQSANGGSASIITNANATISSVLFGSNAVTTSGPGTLTLTGANYLTGGLTISSGTVAANNNQALGDGTTNVVLGDANTGNQNITLSTNAVGGTGGLTIAGSSTQTLSLGTGTSGSAISVDLGSASGSSDKITVGGSVTTNGTTTINIDALTFLASGTTNYTLLTDASGTSMAGGAGFAIGNAPEGTNTYSLANSTAHSLILTVNVVASTTAYWTGRASANVSGGSTDSANSDWGYGAVLSPSQTNWSSTANGLTDPLQEPSTTTDVIFTAANASSVAGALSTRLDTGFSIKGISFDTSVATTPITSVGINTNGHTLTIGADGLGYQQLVQRPGGYDGRRKHTRPAYPGVPQRNQPDRHGFDKHGCQHHDRKPYSDQQRYQYRRCRRQHADNQW
jgi:hypothetical protein